MCREKTLELTNDNYPLNMVPMEFLQRRGTTLCKTHLGNFKAEPIYPYVPVLDG